MLKEIKKEDVHGRNLDAKFTEFEKQGLFDSNINPVNWDGALPVCEDFPYIPKGLTKIKYALINAFAVKPFTWYQAKIIYKVKTVGIENLKGIDAAIVTSNHVAIFDCLVNAYVLRRHKIKTVAAEFNNRRGRFGDLMRVGGMLPLSSKLEIMRKLSHSLEYYLSKKRYILFYPEQSMWPLYDKPRPFKPGAFHYAIKFGVPIIPMFITYRDSGKLNPDNSRRKYFTLNIAKPIYPDKAAPIVEHSRELAEKAYKACVEIYEKTYGKKMIYATADLKTVSTN